MLTKALSSCERELSVVSFVEKIAIFSYINNVKAMKF